jgi:hypothetical protein
MRYFNLQSTLCVLVFCFSTNFFISRLVMEIIAEPLLAPGTKPWLPGPNLQKYACFLAHDEKSKTNAIGNNIFFITNLFSIKVNQKNIINAAT